MNIRHAQLNIHPLLSVVILALVLIVPVTVHADDDYTALAEQVKVLQQQLEQVQTALREFEQQSVKQTDVTALRQEIAQAAEWKDSASKVHLAGYADVGYSNGDNTNGSFNLGTFSPIFHFQYRDLLLLESELEIEISERGETELAMEYLTAGVFVNDYMTLIGGKFLSPIGQFRQNLHPSWINKLASAPPGFGHDGAAPVSDLGVQLRGGFPLGKVRTNYAIYASNGPELKSEFEDGEFELEGVEAEAFGSDADGDKVFGGRLGIIPFAGLEFGFSFATGKAAVTSLSEGHGGAEEADEHDEAGEEDSHDEAVEGDGEEHDEAFDGDLSAEPGRDYDVIGFDYAYQRNNFELRGEFVKTEVGADDVGVSASPGATWETWYSQLAYRIPQSKWEPVIRYTDFDSPHASEDQQQWALGLNYLFSSNVIGKLTYEMNDGQPLSNADADRWMFQLAYGF